MTPGDEVERLRQLQPALAVRAWAAAAIRDFFRGQDYLEVETPVRVAAPALEAHIDAEPSGDAFLRTSPELHMKRLLAAGYARLFQLGPCFRQGEYGAHHHAEYTMLEWYRAGTDYRGILADTQALLRAVATAVLGRMAWTWQGRRIDVGAEWAVWTVQDAFREWAGWDPVAAFDADRFDLDLVERVEPALRAFDEPVVLIDYPAPLAALARRKPDDERLAERWEVYVAGVELANAYSELIDADEQAQRFEACAAQRRTAGKSVYPMDTAFLAALRSGLPPTGGIALGFDRLVMLLADAADLRGVTAFTE
jgi:elongation factor P--(R)-beta-lysine ligase